jgi:hypothetical protein
MEARISRIPGKDITTGDSAVSGLLNGLIGGAAMALVIALFSLLSGQGLAYLTYFSGETPVPPLQGVLMHLGVSCTYGMIYGLLRHWTRLERLKLPRALAGLIYGLGLWALAVTLILPAANSLMLSLPWVVFFSAHAVYGLVLGMKQKP